MINVTGTDKGSYDLLATLKKIGSARIASSGPKGPKLGFIYCSGTWIHGSSNAAIDDLTPVNVASSPTPAAKIVAWRQPMEQEVLAAADVLDTVVLRPALIYGRSCATWSIFFDPLYTAAQAGAETVTVAADTRSRPGLVHVDDVASAFHSAVERLPLIAGTGIYPVFDLVTSQESMSDIVYAAASELRFPGKVEFAGWGDNLFAEAMNANFNGSSGRAKTILGWEPKKIGFVTGMDVFAQAWVASKQDA